MEDNRYQIRVVEKPNPDAIYAVSTITQIVDDKGTIVQPNVDFGDVQWRRMEKTYYHAGATKVSSIPSQLNLNKPKANKVIIIAPRLQAKLVQGVR